jgi:hypothetical protein
MFEKLSLQTEFAPCFPPFVEA